MHDIFLSYSRTDTEIMQQVKQTLLDAGFTVWTDESIELGTPSWKDTIDEAILNCHVLVCILSPDAKESKWVKTELNRAELYEKHIFLILAHGKRRESVPFGFESHQDIDIRVQDNYTNKMNELSKSIQHRISKKSRKKVTPPVEKDIPKQKSTLETKSPQPIEQTEHPELQSSLDAIKSLMPEPFDWCYIPAGEVTLEAGGYVPKGGQTFHVDAFYMAKYPVTNRQFAEFIVAGGYRIQSYWTKEGWELCQEKRWTQPRYFHDTKWNRPTHPVVGVSWYEANAFCNWLNTIETNEEPSTEINITLPIEQQWQRAAQGDDGRKYTWGIGFNKALANTRENKNNSTTPVNQYPEGVSLFGVLDMVGNVQEWCLTDYELGHNDVERQRLNPTILRGGHWNRDSKHCTVYQRDFMKPETTHDGIGFRICAIPTNTQIFT